MEKVSKAKVDRAEYAQDDTALEETSLVEFLVPGPGNRGTISHPFCLPRFMTIEEIPDPGRRV